VAKGEGRTRQVAATALVALALTIGLHDDAGEPGPPGALGPLPTAGDGVIEPGFFHLRCRLLDHHERQLAAEAAQIADEELEPIFTAMARRVEPFAEWAFRWRTSYSLFRRMALGGTAALAQGDLPFDRLRAERDGMVEESIRSLLVVDADAELAAAALRWRERLAGVVDEVDRDHRTALSMYLGFAPPFNAPSPPFSLPESEQASGASDAASDLITTRLVRPVLVRGTIRMGAVFVPPTLLPEVIVGGSLIPGATESVAALLGVDYLVSRLDAWVSRDAFVAELQTTVSGFRGEIREHWMRMARRDIARRLDPWRQVLGDLSGSSTGCAGIKAAPAVRAGAAP